ncbi:DUF2399 domain-containing protein [Streptomyces sp. NPDC058108]|uniref:DUF2399 domain-containing protein n=1 Tax=Streptomyces sp. NPDC058108 TaxID=3346344 RepID=UPI0036EB9B3E
MRPRRKPRKPIRPRVSGGFLCPSLFSLIRGLVASFRCHGAFGLGGLGIATTLLQQLLWRPWRHTADDYR